MSARNIILDKPVQGVYNDAILKGTAVHRPDLKGISRSSAAFGCRQRPEDAQGKC